MESLESKNIVLASGSPRRKELLELLGLQFDILVSSSDEHIPCGLKPQEAVIEIAKRKCLAIYNQMDKTESAVVIGADTIVVSNDSILGKPESPDHAYEILNSLSGLEHQVLTGVVLAFNDGSNLKTLENFQSSNVKFRKLKDLEIRAYIETKEPMDKAGAYALQGLGSAFVEKIDGCYTNVIGLPIPTTVSLLRQAGIKVLNTL